MPGMASSNGRKHGATQDLPLFFCFRRQRSQICRKYSPCFYSWCSAGTRRATVFGSSLTSVSLLDMKSQCGICYLKARRMGAGPCLVECTCGQVLLHQQPNFPMQQWHKHIQATGTPRAGQATATPRAGQATATPRACQAAAMPRAGPGHSHAPRAGTGCSHAKGRAGCSHAKGRSGHSHTEGRPRPQSGQGQVRPQPHQEQARPQPH